MVKRLDPEGCGCVDCLTGYSKPLDEASGEEVLDAAVGNLQNATSLSSDDLMTRVAQGHNPAHVLAYTIAAVLAPARPSAEPVRCEEPWCETPRDCYMACPECHWHRPYCCCK